MRLLRILLSTLVVCTLAACVNVTESGPQSALAGCGGGIDRSITARIEANYAEAIKSGKLDFGFADKIKAAFDATAAPKDKYDSYLACFQNVDARVRKDLQRTQCNSACDSNQTQCLGDQKGVYDQCLRKGQASCMVQCATVYNLSKSQCTENCRADKAHKIGAWEANHKCTIPAASLCIPTISSCKAACNAL